MAKNLRLQALDPATVEASPGSDKPEQFRLRLAGRARRRLGNALGLKNFGVNLTTIKPGGASALRHWHAKQDEFIYIVSGELVLVSNDGEQLLKTGMAAGFPAGKDDGHQLVNRTKRDAVYLEVGDRTANDVVTYPDDDLMLRITAGGRKRFHKDGTPY